MRNGSAMALSSDDAISPDWITIAAFSLEEGTMPLIRTLQRTAFAVVLAGLSAAAFAQFPSRPIRIIPNSAAGTGPDVIARLLAARLTEDLKQPAVVENRPGGNGN